MKKNQWIYIILIMLGLCSVNAFGNQVDIPLSRYISSELTQANQVNLPVLNNSQLLARDAQAATLSQDVIPLRFAEPVPVFITTNTGWDSIQHQVSSGEITQMSVWRTVIRSPGALSINLGFSKFYMPEGGSLFIYTPDYSHSIRPFTAEDNDAHGQLWTPMLPGDSVVIEVNIPTAKVSALELELTSVNHGYLGADMNSILRAQRLSGSCNVDVVCPAGDAWRDQIRSAAGISSGGRIFCSGGALNNTSGDGKPFFLTAHHCGVTASNAASLVVYWNFENSNCRPPGSTQSGGNGDGRLSDFNTGAFFRATYQPSDMTLVELDDPISAAHNVFLSGWNVGSNMATSVTAIHHPRGHEKRISFEYQPVTVTDYNGNTSPGSGTHIRVADWDVGTTEGGSSGSHLFDQNKRVIGQLHGGHAACGNNLPDWYGWLKVSWTGGGTNSTRLSNWLDPTSTGQIAIDGINASGQGSNRAPSFNSDPFTKSAATVTNPYSANISADARDLDGDVLSFSKVSGPAWLSVASDGALSGTPANSDLGVNSFVVQVSDGRLVATATMNILVNSVSAGNVLQNNVPKTGLSGNTNDQTRYTMTVPAGTTRLSFKMSGNSGDADLYMRFGVEPTINAGGWDCRPYTGGSNETCDVTNIQAGTYHIMIRAFSNYSGVSLVGSYN